MMIFFYIDECILNIIYPQSFKCLSLRQAKVMPNACCFRVVRMSVQLSRFGDISSSNLIGVSMYHHRETTGLEFGKQIKGLRCSFSRNISVFF